jgi:hypothetical protein
MKIRPPSEASARHAKPLARTALFISPVPCKRSSPRRRGGPGARCACSRTGANKSFHPDPIGWSATQATPVGCCCCCASASRLALDRHRPDPSHRTVHGPTHLDRGAHARQCAPRLRGLHAASPLPDRSGRVVTARMGRHVGSSHSPTDRPATYSSSFHRKKGVERRSRRWAPSTSHRPSRSLEHG